MTLDKEADMQVNQLPGQEFSIVPAGIYLVGVKKATPGITKDGSKKFVNLQLSILDTEHKGRNVFDKIFLTNEALWRVRTILEAIGELQTDVPMVEFNAQKKPEIMDEDA